ncbi:MAG: CDP-alcohol phosphatidyltransferase family protein [Eubacterium sp.]|nr:CDP-alcohol phosphatidyltransferase family protein [Eubacterium sp.]
MKEFFRKQCANIISTARIIAAISLFFFTKVSYPFVIVYVFCGLSDFVDGKLARKLNISSTLGAALDTIGDVLTYLAFVKILIVQNLVPGWAFVWYIIAMLGNILAGIIAKKRFGEFYLIHSLFGKVLGAVLFILPLLLRMTESIPNNNIICLTVICVVATISAIETIYIQLKSKEQLTDITSLKQLFNL